VARSPRQRGGVAGTLVLDAEGLVKLAKGDPSTYARVKVVREREGDVVTAASTLTEVLRGGPADAQLHRALTRVTVIPLGKEQGRAAGELLGRTGLSGHTCALDALLAVVALAQPRPVVLLTSDRTDLARLTEEPARPKHERIAVIPI
jgi:predicted nucleic acid-binding protein